ncbi:MAG: hypothetical protein J6Z49_06770 [Kiritimatiellae bacterium]|nr:hypothetical protein [Kiritimatiellia bacterium]
MIIVVSILSILLSLLYGALERSRKFSQRAVVFTEIKNIESAFRQYHAVYGDWPTNELADTRLEFTSELASGNDCGFVINEEIGRLLRGVALNDNEAARRFNPRRIPFIEFARLRSGIPVNPFVSAADDLARDIRKYKVLFDTNGDHTLQFSDNDRQPAFSTNIIADIAVWTLIPGTRKGAQSEEDTTAAIPDEVIGSWDSFGVK